MLDLKTKKEKQLFTLDGEQTKNYLMVPSGLRFMKKEVGVKLKAFEWAADGSSDCIL